MLLKSRVTTAGIGLFAALTLAVGGCAESADNPTGGTGANNAGGEPAAQAQDPAAALKQAVTELGKNSTKIRLKLGTLGEMTGVMDPRKKQSQFTMDITNEGTTMNMEMRQVDGETYVKMKMSGGAALPGMDGKKWTRLPKGGKANQAGLNTFDTAKIAETLTSAASVERVGERGFKGTIDLTKAGEALGVDAADVGKLGAKAKAIPFTAEVDDQGRLIRQTIDMPALGTDPAQTLDATYSDFGVAVDVTAPPASEVTTT